MFSSFRLFRTRLPFTLFTVEVPTCKKTNKRERKTTIKEILPFSAHTHKATVTDTCNSSLFYVACSCEMMSWKQQQFLWALLKICRFCFLSLSTLTFSFFEFSLVLCAVLLSLPAPNLIHCFPFSVSWLTLFKRGRILSKQIWKNERE